MEVPAKLRPFRTTFFCPEPDLSAPRAPRRQRQHFHMCSSSSSSTRLALALALGALAFAGVTSTAMPLVLASLPNFLVRCQGLVELLSFS